MATRGHLIGLAIQGIIWTSQLAEFRDLVDFRQEFSLSAPQCFFVELCAQADSPYTQQRFPAAAVALQLWLSSICWQRYHDVVGVGELQSSFEDDELEMMDTSEGTEVP